MANMEIIIGTYEEFLLGYKVENKDDKYSLVQSFADKSHTGSLKCLAVDGHWIASGATDDRIFIYDMKTRKQSQIILSHEGTVYALDFTPDQTHLLSGGADGRMIATNLKSWQPEGVWKKAHDGKAVTNISCHPSGKLALSLGSDLVLRSWNLVKGRVAYKTNLKGRNTLGPMPDNLYWSPNGSYFSLTGTRIVEIWSIKSAEVTKTIITKSKPVCFTWIQDETCLVGYENGKIQWINMEDENENEKEIKMKAHEGRVKAITSFKEYLVTAASSGDVKLWKMDFENKTLNELASINIGCRPTCLGVLDIEQFGPNYILTKTIAELTEKPVKQVLPESSQPKGIVTIEYENDDDVEQSVYHKGEEDHQTIAPPTKKVNKTTKQPKNLKEKPNGENEDKKATYSQSNKNDKNNKKTRKSPADEEGSDASQTDDNDSDSNDSFDDDSDEDGSEDEEPVPKTSKAQKRKLSKNFEQSKKSKLSSGKPEKAKNSPKVKQNQKKLKQKK